MAGPLSFYIRRIYNSCYGEEDGIVSLPKSLFGSCDGKQTNGRLLIIRIGQNEEPQRNTIPLLLFSFG